MRQEIPDFDCFTEPILSRVLEEVPLKHIVDSMFCLNLIQSTDKSQAVSLLEKFLLQDGFSTPDAVDSLPDAWRCWSEQRPLK